MVSELETQFSPSADGRFPRPSEASETDTFLSIIFCVFVVFCLWGLEFVRFGLDMSVGRLGFRALGLRSLGFKGSVGRSRLTASGCRVSSGPRLRRIQAARCLSVSLDFEVTRERKV